MCVNLQKNIMEMIPDQPVTQESISNFLTNDPHRLKAYQSASIKTHNDLKKQKFDISFSGTTAVSVVVNLNNPKPCATCFNTGDS